MLEPTAILTRNIHREMGKVFNALQTQLADQVTGRNMSWNCDYFIPRNNIFKEPEKNLGQNEPEKLIVTEVSRVRTCVDCGKRVGDIAGTYYEIDKKPHCLKCGDKRKFETPLREKQE